MLKISTFFNAIAARISSRAGVQATPPPPRNVDKTYILGLLQHPSRRATSFAALLTFSVLFLSLSPNPAHALPEGLAYCQDDGNGGFIGSDIGAGDQPTAICREFLRNDPTTDIGLTGYFDSSYAYQYYQDSDPLPTLYGWNREARPYTNAELDEAGRWPNFDLMTYITAEDTRQGVFVTYTHTDDRDILYRFNTEPWRANDVGSLTNFIYTNNDNTPDTGFWNVSFDAPASREPAVLLAYSMYTHNRTHADNPIIDMTISITDDDGNTMVSNPLPVSAWNNQDHVPFDGINTVQSPLNWTDIGGGMQQSIVARTPVDGSMPTATNNEIEQIVYYGIPLSGMTVTNIRFDYSGLGGYGKTVTASLHQLFLFKEAPHLYEMVFPLPEGCVVPTPA